jgi:hypothetical protein
MVMIDARSCWKVPATVPTDGKGTGNGDRGREERLVN